MCIYIYVCIYIYGYVCVYMCVYVCIDIYPHTEFFLDLLYSISWLFILLCFTIFQFVDAKQIFILNWHKRNFSPSVRTHLYICIFVYVIGGIAPSDLEKKLLSFPKKLGGLGIPIFSELSGSEYNNSRLLTDHLRLKIASPERRYENDSKLKSIKKKINQPRNSHNTEKL